MKQGKRRSEGIRSLEVVWALNLLWIGLGNYYAGGFKDPRWVLVGALLYVLSRMRLLGSWHFFDPWILGYVVMSIVGHVKVRRHNEKVMADQLRSGRRAIAGEVRVIPAGTPAQTEPQSTPAKSDSATPPESPVAQPPAVRPPADICPSCAAPRDRMRFSCPQCAYMYDD